MSQSKEPDENGSQRLEPKVGRVTTAAMVQQAKRMEVGRGERGLRKLPAGLTGIGGACVTAKGFCFELSPSFLRSKSNRGGQW